MYSTTLYIGPQLLSPIVASISDRRGAFLESLGVPVLKGMLSFTTLVSLPFDESSSVYSERALEGEGL